MTREPIRKAKNNERADIHKVAIQPSVNFFLYLKADSQFHWYSRAENEAYKTRERNKIAPPNETHRDMGGLSASLAWLEPKNNETNDTRKRKGIRVL